MLSLNYLMEIINKRSDRAGVLLSGGNWNNGLKAGVSYRNANNGPTNVNTNIGRHVDLKTLLRSPEQRSVQNQSDLVKHKATHPGVLVHNGRFSRNGRAES